MGISEKIKEIQDEMKRTQVNKATEFHLGVLKAKMAKLRRELIAAASKKSGGGGGFAVKRSGDASVALVGPPSVGKSTLINKITNADSRTAAYQFTTLTVVPGLMEYKGAKIQILDLPGILQGASEGRGRGKEVLSVARSADLILIMFDVYTSRENFIYAELDAMGVRIDQKPPNVVITPKQKDGVVVNSTVPLKRINQKTIESILAVYGMHNAEVVIREDITSDQFIDVLVGNRRYVPSLLVLNKVDLVKKEYLENIKKELGPFVPISAENNTHIEQLKAAIYDKLNLMRVYTKPKMGAADMKEPLMMRRDSTVLDMVQKLHVKDMENNFRFAAIWGKSAKFGGQKVGGKHVLEDGDIVQITSK